jgi:hypothetical protein
MSSKPVLEPMASTFLRLPAGRFSDQAKSTRLDEALHLGDKVFLLDITIISPPLLTRDKSAADTVALSGDQRKNAFYLSRLGCLRSGDTQIIPLSFSALGRLSPQGLEFIYSMARHLGSGSDQLTSKISQKIFQVVSVALFKGTSGILRAYQHLSHPHQ